MMDAYLNKKDLYATVATTVFNNKYEDNLEFYPDGTMNYEGKERRTFCKSIILGIMYGRGAASIAEQVHKTTREAQEIIDQFYKGFPKVKEWVDNTQLSCKQKGYTETLWGRRRRLPDIQLPPYEVRLINPEFSPFNPLLDSDVPQTTTSPLVEKYSKLLQNPIRKKDFDDLKVVAEREGVELLNNMGFISQAERQSVNARVQGGSADITKRAMIAVYNDPVMRELDFHILLCIHDEIIGEVPEENAEKASQRLSELMLGAPKPECQLPFKCDADVFSHWYAQEYGTGVRANFDDLLKKGLSKEEATEEIYRLHGESTRDYLDEVLSAED